MFETSATALCGTTGIYCIFWPARSWLKTWAWKGGAVHGKVLENGKGVRGNQNVGKMWCVNGIKLVLGPGVSKSGLRCQKLLQQVQKNLRSSKFGVTILVKDACTF